MILEGVVLSEISHTQRIGTCTTGSHQLVKPKIELGNADSMK